ncbi:hypothetical protein [Mycolicibacterium sphagni]|uniref:hypothetical protein n=1 Tax=Mycolicibacterium sphagni TaxID=1786 RepID=UPI0021F27ABB|nr:hypothetical protein [Mycolicibacterium sphagni]MCV7174755.1 hypothetical protein [Mycolicibacterium sphagni]
MTAPADFETWLRHGYEQGWCGPPVCSIHDGVPTSEAEDIDYDDGGEPCLHIIRLYEDSETKAAVEANHSPSQWRATNRGLGRDD